jgi:predicted PhzF superfamily epimerase YddE/YHI9
MKIHLVDAFASSAFSGNPAGICVHDSWLADDLMQNIAMELNQAETAFVVPEGTRFGLRWFTPNVEVDLCGHATLAAAHILWETGVVSASQSIEFRSRSGTLTCTRLTDGIELDFPSEAPRAVPAPSGMFGAATQWFQNRMDWLVPLANEEDLMEYVPDLAAIASLGMRGLIITAPATRSDADFVSRFFAPQCAVAEDHVTGSAHCALAPFWQERLQKNPLIGYQASGRGGFVGVKVVGERVKLWGRAVTTLSGDLRVS